MSTTQPKARRVRVPGDRNSNIYVRPDERYEVGYRDSTGVQRWRAPGYPSTFTTISEARRARDAVLGAKAKGERVSPNPRLRFGEAADRWLAGQVPGLRSTTQASYRNSVEKHLRPRWGRMRLDQLSVSDVALLVREMRAEGKAETTISTVIRAASRVFAYARRHLGWAGTSPVGMLEAGERPSLSRVTRRRIFASHELAQVLAAAHEPFRLLFAFAATTGARQSECLGLVWSDLDLSDADVATVSIEHQVDRAGVRRALKTEESRRTIELPRSLVAMLLAHRARSPHSMGDDFVFATRSGRALSQRNAGRELRVIMKRATTPDGKATFPVMHELDDDDNPVPVPRGSVPNFHGFRHTAASEAIAAGDGVEEVSWQLGHKSSMVTRTVYVQEIKSAERTARRRARMEDRYGPLLRDAEAAPQPKPKTGPAKVVELRSAAQA